MLILDVNTKGKALIEGKKKYSEEVFNGCLLD